MGVKGLKTYLDRNDNYYDKCYRLHNTNLVIDGITIAYHLFRSLKTSHQFGEKYDLYGESVHNFFDNLECCKVNPIVVIDSGILTSSEASIEEAEAELKSKKKKKKEGLYLMRQVFMRIVRLKGIKMVQIIGDAGATIAAIAGQYDCPVLTSTGDYFLRGIKFIPLSEFRGKVKSSETGESPKNWMFCKLFKFDIFLRNVKILDKEHLLPLALLILGHKKEITFLPPQVLIPLFSRLQDRYRSRNFQESHNKIENTLKWLGDCSSLEEAVGELVSCVDKKYRKRILEIVEEKINDISTPSLQALHTLRFPEEVIQRAVENVMNVGNVDLLESRILKEVNSTNHEDSREIEEKKVVKWSEEQLSQHLPRWIMRDYSSGAISTSVLKLCIKPIKKLLEHEAEDYDYPPVAMISIPIIKAIYSLILTLQEDEESDLKFYIARDERFIVQVERVVKASMDLRKMENIRDTVKRRFIDDVLGIDGNKLKKLPREWRLYVMTVMFWMRQEQPPLKTEAHLNSVLFAMLIAIIDKKIGFVRSEHLYDRRFGGIDPETLRNRGRAKEDVSLQDLVHLVSNAECILALSFFLDHIPEEEVGAEDWWTPWKIVVHTFNQLHSCLKSVIELNEILNYAYEQISIPEFFNGALLYGLFEDFSKQPDVDSYLRMKLRYTPNIVEIFRKLRDLVVSEL